MFEKTRLNVLLLSYFIVYSCFSISYNLFFHVLLSCDLIEFYALSYSIFAKFNIIHKTLLNKL